ncbi:transporter substrate-binding domain-containing protein [Shewanella indica]|uniref:substrate-binding periplasmic protein n=1 Tax=Shewanella indica TaxID=768528 RepID=UPI001F33A9FF|nr:transporter substrate-binding domain-containing protein [Shewanella indica]MCE9790270.1 transporter substrate-binding domain-containing protein [Shewanella indica]
MKLTWVFFLLFLQQPWLAFANCNPSSPSTSEPAVPLHLTLTNDPWPPFIETDGKTGLALEIVQSALAVHCYRLQVELKPWARALRSAKEAKTDLLLATWHTPEREQVLLFSEPYLQNRQRFIKRRGDPFEYTDLDSLNGKRIGVVRGYSYQTGFRAARDFIRVPNNSLESNLKMLAVGRLDLTLEDEIVATDTFWRLHQEDSFDFTGPPLDIRNLHLSTSRLHPHGAELIAEFNQGLETIKKNGEYAKILAKYGAILQGRRAPPILHLDGAMAKRVKDKTPNGMFCFSQEWPASHPSNPAGAHRCEPWRYSQG